MAKGMVNLQDSFLNQVRKDNTEIEMVLLDGTHLTGAVRGFDNFTVVVNAQGNQHLVYKHAIAQIIGRRPIETFGPRPDHRQERPEHRHERPEPRGEDHGEARPERGERSESRQPTREPQPPREPRPAPPAQDPPSRTMDPSNPRTDFPRPMRPENPRPAPRPDREDERSKFNTIDLSDVKLGKGKVE